MLILVVFSVTKGWGGGGGFGRRKEGEDEVAYYSLLFEIALLKAFPTPITS